MIISLFAPHTIRSGDRAGDIVPGRFPSRWKTTWSEFVSTLRDSAAIDADPAQKTNVVAISCSEFREGSERKKDNVIGCDAIGFDFDDKGGGTPGAWTFDRLVAFMEASGSPYLIHTTASCREGAQCLRLIMPLSRRITPLEFPNVWRAFATWLGSVADEATKDASRVFFSPQRWRGRYNRFHDGHAVRPEVDVDAILARLPPPEPPMAVSRCRAPTRAHVFSARTAADKITDLDSSRIISRAALDEALTAREGGRMYRFLCKVAARARWAGISLTVDDLAAIGTSLAQRIGRRHIDDIERDARNALRFTEKLEPERHRVQVTRPTIAMPRYW